MKRAWTKADATEQDDSLTSEQQDAWVTAANKASDDGEDDDAAIAAGNAACEDSGDDEEGDERTAAPPQKKPRKSKPKVRTPDDMMARREVILGPSSYDPSTREADAVISTGAAVRRMGWDGAFDEVLEVKPGAIRLARLNAGGQLIDGHNWYDGMDSVLGAVVPGTARIEGGKLIARFRFSRSAKGERIAQDLKDGLPLPLSAGYKIHQFTEDNTVSPPQRRVTDWEPMEVSVVPVPAEEIGTGFRSHQPIINNGTGARNTMTEDDRRAQQAKAEEATRAANAANETAAREAAADAEKKKKKKEVEEKQRSELAAQAADIISIGTKASIPMDRIQEAIRQGVSVDAFRAEAFEVLAGKSGERGPRGGTNGGGQDPTKVEVVRDENEGRSEAMTEAMVIRILSARRDAAGITSQRDKWWCEQRGVVDQVAQARKIHDGHEQPKNPQTRQYLGMGMVEMAATAAGFRGYISPDKAWKLISDVFDKRAGTAFQTTSDYPAIFLNALNKVLLARYQLIMPTYREVAIERPFVDFRPHPQIRAGEFPSPQLLTETGELRVGASVDSKEVVQVVPYGVIYGISRQMIVNDELGAIDQILGTAGDSVLIFENRTFWNMFLANPVLLQDSTAVFDATTHHNYTASGTVPDVITVGTARQALRNQKSLSGNYLNAPPTIILTGPALETVADQLTTSIGATWTAAVNPFSGNLRSVADANIQDNSWYVFTDPGRVPCFVYGFLGGASGPRLRTEEPFGRQGINISLEVDFGCGAIDYRGCYKNAGKLPSEPSINLQGT